METPNLILSINEGPKKGETIDRRPRSFIRIGRVVRGNTLAIKDPGISQKHLIVEFHQQISRWAVTDLGTSNGTTVNGAVISPNAAFPLADCDVIEIGENTLISVKISTPSSAPEPRTRRGRRIAADATSPIEKEVEEEKVAEPAKHGGRSVSQGKTCPESVNVDEVVKRMPEEGKRRRPTRASAKSSAKSCSARGPKMQEEVDVKEHAEKLAKNYQEGRAQRKKGIISAGSSRNDKALQPVVEGDEEMKGRVEEPANNKGKHKAKCKRGGRSTRISRKGEALEKVAIGEKMKGSLSKALDVVVVNSARVPKDLLKKKMLVALDLNSVYSKGQEKKKLIVKSNASGDGKKLVVSKEVRFGIVEAKNYKDIMMPLESNKTVGMHFPGKEELANSWSSFSKIRGIPNTTNKYREDRMINCHATPFEARVERALNRGTAETSSSMET